MHTDVLYQIRGFVTQPQHFMEHVSSQAFIFLPCTAKQLKLVLIISNR